jgi:hypothetical protein
VNFPLSLLDLFVKLMSLACFAIFACILLSLKWQNAPIAKGAKKQGGKHTMANMWTKQGIVSQPKAST